MHFSYRKPDLRVNNLLKLLFDCLNSNHALFRQTCVPVSIYRFLGGLSWGERGASDQGKHNIRVSHCRLILGLEKHDCSASASWDTCVRPPFSAALALGG